MIFETIVTTRDATGNPHLAPMGVRFEAGRYTISPFRPSTTLDNLAATGLAVVNFTDDVRVFAGSLTGRRHFPFDSALKIDCPRLAEALGHAELQVEAIQEDAVRPRYTCRVVATGMHGPWPGFNRAQAAVIEAAILVSRLDLLPADKIDHELDYLTIAVEKTAGEREREAWDWLLEKITAHRQARAS